MRIFRLQHISLRLQALPCLQTNVAAELGRGNVATFVTAEDKDTRNTAAIRVMSHDITSFSECLPIIHQDTKQSFPPFSACVLLEKISLFGKILFCIQVRYHCRRVVDT